VEDFRRNLRDLYVPAGDISFWQGVVRDTEDPLYQPLSEAIRSGTRMGVELLYGDHEGGQRTITRFVVAPRSQATDDEPWLWICSAARHWYLDRPDPR
jgi:hypothetical protein